MRNLRQRRSTPIKINSPAGWNQSRGNQKYLMQSYIDLFKKRGKSRVWGTQRGNLGCFSTDCCLFCRYARNNGSFFPFCFWKIQVLNLLLSALHSAIIGNIPHSSVNVIYFASDFVNPGLIHIFHWDSGLISLGGMHRPRFRCFSPSSSSRLQERDSVLLGWQRCVYPVLLQAADRDFPPCTPGFEPLCGVPCV